MANDLQGVELVRAVIEKVREKGFVGTFGQRRVTPERDQAPIAPEVLDGLRLGGGVPLTPCLREWLAFDGSLFEWPIRDGKIAAERLGAVVSDHFDGGEFFAGLGKLLPKPCHRL